MSWFKTFFLFKQQKKRREQAYKEKKKGFEPIAGRQREDPRNRDWSPGEFA